ncbi:MAG TPA: 3-hydroxyacyl-CoA dehydrogenase/enoyl-CoA hydratase family protein [Chloroflexi bacterium]|nr:3-hydroxyacyl-CoA dehydrogenase/enoyl-CoA hydratase family protein [Chloroflexota bacterium]
MSYQIRRAAVIGAGTMGAAIAAHFANVGIPVDLLDIVPRELTPEEKEKGLTLDDPAVRNRIVSKGWEAALKARPAALYSKAKAALVRLGNLEDDFDRLSEADLIIEAVIENLPIKQSLMERVEAVRKPTAVVATNTSGLLIRDIAEGRGEAFRQHFLGMHFFNPPRYLRLLEIIPHTDTLPEVLEAMTRFAEDTLGKGVVRCKDTPNFIANRLFSNGASFEIAYAIEHGYSIEEVDKLTGPLIGRPKTAVFRLLDLVGLDVMEHVSTNLYEAIPEDESRDLLLDPRIMEPLKKMIERGWLGNKAGQGFYKRVEKNGKKEFWTLDFETMEYTPPQKVRFESVGKYRKLEPLGARLKALVEADDRAGEYIRNVTYNRLTYASRRIPEIADSIVSVDNAIKWGFAHQMGPFEEWDALGVAESIEKMEAAGFPVADWVKEMVEAGYESFYQYENGVAVGYYDLEAKGYLPFEEKPKEIKVNVLVARDKVIESNEEASIIDMGDGIALFEWHSKANTLTPAVIEMGYRAIERLGTDFDGLVIGHDGSLFSGGANLDMAAIQQEARKQGVTPAEVVDQLAHQMQQMMLGFRYAPGPVVTAPFDRALGGGAELTMCGDRIVAHAELYIGLVEVGLGLIPAATGCKEMLRRIVNPMMRIENADPIPVITRVFEQIGLARYSTSAEEAREMGFLGPCDRIVTNRDHLLAEAKREALHMVQSGYRPPLPEKIYAAGRDVLAAIQTQLYMMKDAGYITEHDSVVGGRLAWVLCGGDLSEPTWVDEQYILDLERQAFVELIQMPKTIERIMHMLTTGKPLRN